MPPKSTGRRLLLGLAAALLLARAAMAGSGELKRPEPLKASPGVFLSPKVKTGAYKPAPAAPGVRPALPGRAERPGLAASAIPRAAELLVPEEPAAEAGIPSATGQPEGRFAGLLKKYRDAAASLFPSKKDSGLPIPVHRGLDGRHYVYLFPFVRTEVTFVGSEPHVTVYRGLREKFDPRKASDRAGDYIFTTLDPKVAISYLTRTLSFDTPKDLTLLKMSLPLSKAYIAKRPKNAAGKISDKDMFLPAARNRPYLWFLWRAWTRMMERELVWNLKDLGEDLDDPRYRVQLIKRSVAPKENAHPLDRWTSHENWYAAQEQILSDWKKGHWRHSLLDRLRAKLSIVTSGGKAQKAREASAIDAALERIMESPTARELAYDFVKQGTKVLVSFANLSNVKAAEKNGRKVLETTRGATTPRGTHVILNREYLETDPAFQRLNLHVTLGHELLGHVPKHQQAHGLGLSGAYTAGFRDDETYARLVGWLIAAETLGEIEDPDMWNYLKDPERYHNDLQLRNPVYAVTLSRAEMADPVPALQTRLDRIRRAREAAKQAFERDKVLPTAIEHFILAHGVEAALFETLKRQVEQDLNFGYSNYFARLDAIEEAVERQIRYYATAEGRSFAGLIQEAAENPLFKEVGTAIETFTRELHGLIRGKSPQAVVAPPIPGQLSWEDFRALKEEDLRLHPEHWVRR